jgi:hypothetical protein
MTGFTGLLQLVVTNQDYALADLHTLRITITHAGSYQYATVISPKKRSETKTNWPTDRRSQFNSNCNSDSSQHSVSLYVII